MARTPNIGLFKPDPGQPGYQTLHDVNMDILDKLAIQYTGAITIEAPAPNPTYSVYTLSDEEAKHGVFNVLNDNSDLPPSNPMFLVFPPHPRGMFVVNNGTNSGDNNSINVTVDPNLTPQLVVPPGGSAFCFTDGVYVYGVYSVTTPLSQLLQVPVDNNQYPTADGQVMKFNDAGSAWGVGMPVKTSAEGYSYPATSTSTVNNAGGIPGDIMADNSYLYVKCPDGKWRRIAFGALF